MLEMSFVDLQLFQREYIFFEQCYFFTALDMKMGTGPYFTKYVYTRVKFLNQLIDKFMYILRSASGLCESRSSSQYGGSSSVGSTGFI